VSGVNVEVESLLARNGRAPAADGVSVENSVCLGGLDACQTAALELMEEKRKIALEGFHLEEVAALCFKLNYRWRFDGSRDQRLRFIVEPGVQSPLPDGRPRPASDSSSGGRD
jgi:hypothetical protein